MTICETSDELGIAYLLALDGLQAASRGLAQSVTVTQREGAATWLSRAEAHALYCKGELLFHCRRHGCPIPLPGLELAEILRQAAQSAASSASGAAA
jgi:hypothetical protein